MHSLTIQVQPHLSAGMPVDRVTEAFEAIARQSDVKRHLFDAGNDEGEFLNYTFGVEDLGKLWTRVRKDLYNDMELGLHMRRASMAMCTGQNGWDDYRLLFHYDPSVHRDSADAL